MKGVLRVWHDSFKNILDHPEIEKPSHVATFTDLIRSTMKNETADAEAVRNALIDWKQSQHTQRLTTDPGPPHPFSHPPLHFHFLLRFPSPLSRSLPSGISLSPQPPLISL